MFGSDRYQRDLAAALDEGPGGAYVEARLRTAQRLVVELEASRGFLRRATARRTMELISSGSTDAGAADVEIVDSHERRGL
ncbi:MAG: hypothetical protein WAS07_00525 [Micropruina sp.]